MLFKRLRDQYNGNEDYYLTLQNDWLYEDWHRDAEDLRMVNFRYSDHEEVVPSAANWSNQIYKPDADKYKAGYRYYRYGTDSKWDKFTGFLRDKSFYNSPPLK